MDATHSERMPAVNKLQSDLPLNFTLLSDVQRRPSASWASVPVFLVVSLHGWFGSSFPSFPVAQTGIGILSTTWALKSL